MKSSKYIITGILLVTVVVLFIQCNGKKGDTKHPENAENKTDSTNLRLPIAFVRIDSLLAHYKFFTDQNEALMKKIEDKKLIINQKGDNLKKQIIDFQQKAQNNAFISRERQDQEQSRLAGLQQDLETYSAQMNQELATDQGKMSQRVQDTIIAALKIFNNPKKYQFIFSNAGTDNILYADDVYDITKEVTDFLNARYVPSK